MLFTSWHSGLTQNDPCWGWGFSLYTPQGGRAIMWPFELFCPLCPPLDFFMLFVTHWTTLYTLLPSDLFLPIYPWNFSDPLFCNRFWLVFLASLHSTIALVWYYWIWLACRATRLPQYCPFLLFSNKFLSVPSHFLYCSDNPSSSLQSYMPFIHILTS